MKFEQFEAENRRLCILRLLAEDADYRTNSATIELGLDAFGLAVSRDRLHTDFSWLAEQGLLSLEPMESVYVVTLTQRGLDVAQGRSVVPGVKRPGPRGG